MKVSLIISTYNSPEYLSLCLGSAISQTKKPNEIIIADDGSKAQTKILIEEIAKASTVPIKHIWQEDKGFRKTIVMNKAISASEGDYIIQIDGDIVMHKKFVEDHISLAKEGCFIRGGRTLINKEQTDKIVEKGEYKPSFVDVLRLENTFNALRIPMLSTFFNGESNDVFHVKGCNMAYWKADFIRVNGYNNDIAGWGHEDIELAVRLYNAGVKMRKIKFKAIEYHLHHNFNPRNSEDDNFKIFEQALKENIVITENGYNQTEE